MKIITLKNLLQKVSPLLLKSLISILFLYSLFYNVLDFSPPTEANKIPSSRHVVSELCSLYDLSLNDDLWVKSNYVLNVTS